MLLSCQHGRWEGSLKFLEKHPEMPPFQLQLLVALTPEKIPERMNMNSTGQVAKPNSSFYSSFYSIFQAVKNLKVVPSPNL